MILVIHVFIKSKSEWLLHNCGVIDPENIEEYIGKGWLFCLSSGITEMTPKKSLI